MSDHDQASATASALSTDVLAAWKSAAARAAVAEVPQDAVIGLGTGSTADIMLAELAARVSQGLRVTGVATSERTRKLASELGIPLADLDAVDALTLSIDGADEVSLPDLNLIKGLGGALLREKLIAAASRHRIIIVDETKLVTALGTRHPVPVEIIPFGWRHTVARLTALGAEAALRRDPTGAPYVTDGGNYVLDCRFAPITAADDLASQIKATLGVVEHGLFISMTERVYVGGPNGVRVLDRAR